MVQLATDKDLDQILSEQPKVIIKFYADWCGNCKLFAPKFRRLSEDERFAGTHFLDINAEENEMARKKAGVNNLPYFAVFKDGQLVDGAATSLEDKVVELLNKIQS